MPPVIYGSLDSRNANTYTRRVLHINLYRYRKIQGRRLTGIVYGARFFCTHGVAVEQTPPQSDAVITACFGLSGSNFGYLEAEK